MKFWKLLVMTLTYGLVFHGIARLFIAIFDGRNLFYVAVCALLAAAASVAIWWRPLGRLDAQQSFLVGGLSVALVLANSFARHGLAGFLANPLHQALTLLIVFLAVPMCAYAASARRVE